MSGCHSCINKQRAATKRGCLHETTQQSSHGVWIRCLSRARPDPLPIKPKDENHREGNKYTDVSKLWWSHIWVAKQWHHIHLLTFRKKVQPMLELKGRQVLPEPPCVCQTSRRQSIILNQEQQGIGCCVTGQLCLQRSPLSPPSSSSPSRLLLKGRDKG